MPVFGVHTSTAGGLVNAVREATKLGCETFQMFTKNANQWQAKPLQDSEIAQFRRELHESGLRFPTAHDSYLINLASADDALREKSIAAFRVEYQRAEALGLQYLVMHPGAALKSPEDEALARVVESFDRIHSECPDFRVQILVETTAGQGSTLGYRFEHLATILGGVREPQRMGVCLDTCHVFAAGYALEPQAAYDATFAEFDRVIGLSWIRLFHVNDSVKPLGSRVDRHAAIGQGAIGLAAFQRLVRDPRFTDLPMILETPKTGDDDQAMDPINLQTLRNCRIEGSGDSPRDPG
ncbi:deoxyribonuclease IV [Tuwongella immobilis]|uniref:Probable endonuclease 4 n=1 Tax=Tuwongella immobilis TaxID=692036 RepID=A0A6C2YQ65_9BACT|nr:deoxyribonuclease IV [Tuwongella immobilis]VIP03319.1 endonuclease iv : Probable endonuclease 4 OS=Planctomyces brasiliensis (strain ATCC 49424 / DSM 5305 / JCM 21570 / NBRC 103401 / IFAM 1448) GN=nfo PE=3 SV=1: AP_endonuc_2 [Tuwongella immobilis]VTS04009.1 endonuclease iv : Probable endonuclease 4 OS=Planctomyces brasiliensis (strain ATCC 49424 / DSM 5305 / JCM 21570 / NBRC 103401 / IFAM 1448) GN=nfo PE=3 SV=1: AP_endonuc_2 [Tuwongella immobilis]